MKACVIGGGPAGLYFSKFLLRDGHKVDLYESTHDLLGNYKKLAYSPNPMLLKSTISNENLNIRLGEKIKDLPKGYDLYVLATGGKERKLKIEGSEHTIMSSDFIQNTDKYIKNIEQSKIGIIGMGNVALDVAKRLIDLGSKNISIFSRSPIENIKFRIPDFKSLLRKKLNIKIENNTEETPKQNVIQNLIEKFKKDNGPNLTLYFNSLPIKITKDKNLTLIYQNNDKIKAEKFNYIIQSIGYTPNPIKNTFTYNKPLVSVGWCKYGTGNLQEIYHNTKTTYDQLIKEIQTST